MRSKGIYVTVLSVCAGTLCLAPASISADTNAAAAVSDSKAAAEIPQVRPITAKQQQADNETIKGVNAIPGVSVKPATLNTSPELPAIKGFHPIKRALRPVVQLERNSVDLQKQIMRLEGPIAGLQQPMLGLQKKMGSVENKMGSMQTAIGSMQNQVGSTGNGVNNVNKQMVSVRQDLHQMEKDINNLQQPISRLQAPLEALQGPLGQVAGPLRDVYKELAEMKALLQLVVVMIVFSAIAIAIGTPLAAVLLYRNRRKLFPNMSDHDFPVAKAEDAQKRTPTRV